MIDMAEKIIGFLIGIALVMLIVLMTIERMV